MATTDSATTNQMISGADILVQALVRNGIETIFAYPGGASMPLHQALLRNKEDLRTILPRHEQGGGQPGAPARRIWLLRSQTRNSTAFH